MLCLHAASVAAHLESAFMRVAAALFWLSLVVWFAAAVAPGAAAASVFATVPRMPISIAEIDPYFAQDSKELGRFVAGRAIQPLFDATDWVQMIAAAMCVSTSLRLWRMRGFAGVRWMSSVAVGLVLAAAVLFAIRLLQTNAMRADLAVYWQAVVDLDRTVGVLAKERFDQSHRVVERLASLQVASLLAAVVAAAIASAPPRRSEPELA